LEFDESVVTVRSDVFVVVVVGVEHPARAERTRKQQQSKSVFEGIRFFIIHLSRKMPVALGWKSVSNNPVSADLIQ
jgi:hypothetical protein